MEEEIQIANTKQEKISIPLLNKEMKFEAKTLLYIIRIAFKKKSVLVRIWNKNNPHTFAFVGMQSGTAYLENSLSVSYKIKHILIIQIQQSHS